jgi:enediyne biosynthesis protein E4
MPIPRSSVLLLIALLAAGGAALGYVFLWPRHSGDGTAPATASAPSSPTPAVEWFIDAAQEAGLDFVHFNGMSGGLYYAEHMGPGVALFDYDNDGDLDVFLPQGRMLGTGKTLSQALFPPKDGRPPKGRLFRNDLEIRADGTRTLRFTDVTEASGLNATGYGMGVTAGDYDNDGCVDLYVTTLGRNQMFRNRCDGTFTDVSKASGTDDSGWSVSAAFVDYDRDGWLDLFVGHYLNYTPDANTLCYSVAGKPDYCPPHIYSAQPSHLFHNNRNGTFTDVTASAGLSREFGPALGVVAADFNADGWPDLYVANDGQPNQLWMNQRDGTFKNVGLLAGVALSAEGDAKSSMGVDAGDFDNDGDDDLLVTELTGQGSDLYVNDGMGIFVDQSARSRLRYLTLPFTGFGTAWFDFDNDGWLDTLSVNGAVTSIQELARANDPFPLHQRKQLLRNLGNGQFEDVTSRAGGLFQREQVGRGAAFGDVDNDGDTDVVVANDNGPAELLINQIGSRQHWVGLRLVGEKGRDMLGARVSISPGAGGSLKPLWRRARADGSYGSSNDPRVLAGFGSSSQPVRVQVVWPDGRMEEWADVPVDKYTTLKQGSGK